MLVLHPLNVSAAMDAGSDVLPPLLRDKYAAVGRIGIVSATVLRLAPCKTRLAHRLVQSAATSQDLIALRKTQSWNALMGNEAGAR